MSKFTPDFRDVAVGAHLGAVRPPATTKVFELVYRCEAAPESPR